MCIVQNSNNKTTKYKLIDDLWYSADTWLCRSHRMDSKLWNAGWMFGKQWEVYKLKVKQRASENEEKKKRNANWRRQQPIIMIRTEHSWNPPSIWLKPNCLLCTRGTLIAFIRNVTIFVFSSFFLLFCPHFEWNFD